MLAAGDAVTAAESDVDVAVVSVDSVGVAGEDRNVCNACVCTVMVGVILITTLCRAKQSDVGMDDTSTGMMVGAASRGSMSRGDSGLAGA